MFELHIVKEVLLNFFLILTPIYFYKSIVTYFQTIKGRVLLGIISGLGSILCMIFPIVSGAGFLWDLRWISFVVSILYGGWLSGAIAGILLVVFRFLLGGMAGAINVLLVALILFFLFSLLRVHFQYKPITKKIFLGLLYAIIAFFIVGSAIWIHFWYSDKLDFFYQNAPSVSLFMFLYYILSMSIFIIFAERIFSHSQFSGQVNDAEKANMVSELILLMSYDVKKYMNQSKNWMQLAMNSDGDSSKALMINAVKEIDSGAAVLDSFVNYSRYQNSENDTVAVQTVFSEMAELLNPYLHVKNVELEKDIHQGVKFEGDVIKLRQILLNILKNAVDASGRGGKIYFSSQEEKGNVLITVKDEGIGMTREQITRIMNPSFKGERQGLGLIVTRKLLEDMKGNLIFESEPGKGTSAKVKIPNK